MDEPNMYKQFKEIKELMPKISESIIKTATIIN